jgi:hypothetical protein
MSLENMTEDERNSLALKKLFNHPEVGPQAKRLYKKVVPDARFADIELEDQIAASKKETDKEIETLREKLQMQEITNRRDAQHKMVRDAGFDPVEIEKVMTDEKISSYETAVKYMRAQQKSAPASPASVTPIRMPDNLGEIQKDPRAWANKTAFEAINEIILQRKQG